MVQKLANGLYQFKNGAQAKKLANGQYRIVKGASKKKSTKTKQQGGQQKRVTRKKRVVKQQTKKVVKQQTKKVVKQQTKKGGMNRLALNYGELVNEQNMNRMPISQMSMKSNIMDPARHYRTNLRNFRGRNMLSSYGLRQNQFDSAFSQNHVTRNLTATLMRMMDPVRRIAMSPVYRFDPRFCQVFFQFAQTVLNAHDECIHAGRNMMMQGYGYGTAMPMQQPGIVGGKRQTKKKQQRKQSIKKNQQNKRKQ